MKSDVVSIAACDEVVYVGTHGIEDQASNLGVWDVRTGNLLQTFRNGSSAPYSLCLLGNESLLAASHTKPVIHVWSMLRQSQKHRKLICGKMISCLAVTPDGNYIAAGLEDKLHIWQVCTGELYSVLSHCSAELKCLKFSPTGEFLVAGYKDGTVAVWELQDSLHQDTVRIADQSPVSTFSGHTGEITGLHITLTNKVVSCAMDFTVKIWDLLSSEELKMFELGAPICSVIVDHSEFVLYAGDYNGNVYCIDLFYEPGERSVHIDTRQESRAFTSYVAHIGPVQHMCLTSDQSRLVTASDDKLVKIWSLMSPVSPVVITVNDKVSNLLVAPTPGALIFPDQKPRVTIGNLSRHLHSSEETSEEVEITTFIGKPF
ncbi:hypothetical protein EGW08_006989 [Elysia chlorotica]|uniref:TEP-1 C-terminal beta-propeller domain-containing protein n=1 Tax=Elysia chlorotica TaxID=188477 RepID=A0A433TUQ9_ELYCH|nr:hypothetical protein EGW08_006989 [Elysia chlorotica]